MGELFEALQILNRTYDLGLSGQQILRAEADFKQILAERVNFPKEFRANDQRLAGQWEIMTYLKPREEKMTMDQLADLAERSVKEFSSEKNIESLKRTSLQDLMKGKISPKNPGLRGPRDR